jgi:hypothetical protein
MNFKINALRPLRVGRIVAVVVLAGLAQTALACNLGAWLGGNQNVLVGQPTPDNIPRYSGVCAMATQDGSVGWVQDNSPAGISRIRARFYVLPANEDETEVYEGYNSAGSRVFRVWIGTGSSILLRSGGASVGSSSLNRGRWNSVEVDWNAGAGELSLIVNGGAPQTTSFTSAELVDSVRLGNLRGVAGVVTFDAYESRRSTEIGRLLVGDANGDTDINVGDITAVANERFDSTLALGQPDCNEDGSVDVGDITCLANIIFG